MTGLLILAVAVLFGLVLGHAGAIWQSWQDRRDEFRFVEARGAALDAMARWWE